MTWRRRFRISPTPRTGRCAGWCIRRGSAALFRRARLWRAASWESGDPPGESSFASFLDNGGIGLLLQFMLTGLVAPAVIAATAEIRAADRTSYRDSQRASSRKIPVILGALVYNYVIVLLLSLTVVLIPFALYRQVQWAYAPHAIVIDGEDVRNSRKVSRDTIKGDWLRTLGMAVLVTLVAGIPGPVIGMGLILLRVVPLDVAGYVSSAIFAIVYPITVIASTLYYLWRKDQHATESTRSAQAGMWDRVRHALWGGHVPHGAGVPVGKPGTVGGVVAQAG